MPAEIRKLKHPETFTRWLDSMRQYTRRMWRVFAASGYRIVDEAEASRIAATGWKYPPPPKKH